MSEKYPYIQMLPAPELPAEVQEMIDACVAQIEQVAGVTELFESLFEKSMTSPHAIRISADATGLKTEGPFPIWRKAD